MNMRILIANSSPDPIYEQILRQVKAQIIAGDLREGEPLPSIRKLAQDLQISVITTKRAYDGAGKPSTAASARPTDTAGPRGWNVQLMGWLLGGVRGGSGRAAAAGRIPEKSS